MIAEMVAFEDGYCYFKKGGQTYKVHYTRLDAEGRARVALTLFFWDYQNLLANSPRDDFNNSLQRIRAWEKEVEIARKDYNQAVEDYNAVVEEIRFQNMSDSELRQELARLRQQVENSKKSGSQMYYVTGSDGLYHMIPIGRD